MRSLKLIGCCKRGRKIHRLCWPVHRRKKRPKRHKSKHGTKPELRDDQIIDNVIYLASSHDHNERNREGE
ncbi:MAG: hypothetical protein CMN74_12535 [Sphingorhabdus sp.]|nr:hypothetical protein [Sphingorhabdus sp.]